MKQHNKITIDASLALINRTGAYYIARDIVDAFSSGNYIRYWRLWNKYPNASLVRKFFGRLMLKEIQVLKDSPIFQWPEKEGSDRIIYLDPLYVLRNKLSSNDIVLCHDIGPITHPELYEHKTIDLYHLAYQKIKHIGPGMVFVSETSKNQFMKHFGTNYRLLKTISLYLRSYLQQGDEVPVEGLVPQRYFLSVGVLNRRKNYINTIKAFAQGEFALQGYQLVICGPNGDISDEIKSLAANTPSVRVMGYVSDENLRWLYKNAAIFVIPSLFEGFGMPALEAAAFGVPVVVSKDSALADAVNGLGVQVNQHDFGDIANGIQKILSMDDQEIYRLKQQLVGYASTATKANFISQWRTLLEDQS